ncbi:MAG TPA: hypothetical protein V6C52_13165 [Coleofasciculaceae cyanobacterium]
METSAHKHGLAAPGNVCEFEGRGTMSALQFGMICATDIKPGFAFVNPGKAKNVYVVTERVDDAVYHDGGAETQPLPSGQTEPSPSRYKKKRTNASLRGTGKSQPAGWTEVRFRADRYEGQTGGFYKKAAECQTPVVFNADGTNPSYDSVTIERKKGDKLWIKA